MKRRDFIQKTAAAGVITTLGGSALFANGFASAEAKQQY